MSVENKQTPKKRSTKPKPERQYLTAISIDSGIITLIEPDGTLGYYRQRGIQRLRPEVISMLCSNGYLNPNWMRYKELPSNYSIAYEDEEIMGKAHATFSAGR